MFLVGAKFVPESQDYVGILQAVESNPPTGVTVTGLQGISQRSELFSFLPSASFLKAPQVSEYISTRIMSKITLPTILILFTFYDFLYFCIEINKHSQ